MMKVVRVLVLALVFSNVQAVKADVISEEWIQYWRADLDFVQQTLPETHAQLFHTLSEEDFNAAASSITSVANVPYLRPVSR